MARMSTLALVCAVLAAAPAMAHPGGHPLPDAAFARRHADTLSEACRRKGRTLDNDTCLLDPEMTGGPYVYDTAPIRYNITEGWPGIPMILNISVVNSSNCEDISGAAIEIWHCTSGGIYSHFVEASVGNGTDEDDSQFLRGIQYTDSNGSVSFGTIWPGWYAERALHIHVRVHFNINASSDNSSYSGGTVGHVGQLFANDSIVEELAQVYPYSENTIERTSLDVDIHYQANNGTYGLMTLTEMYEGEGLENGILAHVTLGVYTLEADEFDSSILGGPGGEGGPGGNFTMNETSTTAAPSTPAPATPAPATPTPATPAPADDSSASFGPTIVGLAAVMLACLAL